MPLTRSMSACFQTDGPGEPGRSPQTLNYPHTPTPPNTCFPTSVPHVVTTNSPPYFSHRLPSDVVASGLPASDCAASVISRVFERVNCDDLVGSTKGQESVAELRRQRSMLDQEELDLERRRVRIDAHLSDRGHPHNFDAKPSPAESNLVGLFKELLCEMHSNSLPKLEIEPFSGEPEQFYTFLCSFRQEVEAKVADPHKRLSYLLHYCRGPAKDAIRHCVLLPSATCFATAMDILRSQFGRPSQIIQAVTENMFTGPPIRHDDVEGLQIS